LASLSTPLRKDCLVASDRLGSWFSQLAMAVSTTSSICFRRSWLSSAIFWSLDCITVSSSLRRASSTAWPESPVEVISTAATSTVSTILAGRSGPAINRLADR